MCLCGISSAELSSSPPTAWPHDWGKYLGYATVARTILDRFMHRWAMLEFEGTSYRLNEAAARLAVITPSLMISSPCLEHFGVYPEVGDTRTVAWEDSY